jgi:primosomal protein N'
VKSVVLRICSFKGDTMPCEKCDSNMVFEDPMGGRWCHDCGHVEPPKPINS